MMKQQIALMSILSIALFTTGCESKSGTGALVGGGLGAGAGALISPTPEGVLIGAAVGAATGALVGSSLEDSDKDKIQSSSPQTMQKIDRGEQLSIDDIKKMAQAGLSDETIIQTIQSTGSIYHLSSSDITELQHAGISQKVIDAMMQTAY